MYMKLFYIDIEESCTVSQQLKKWESPEIDS